MKVCLNCGQQFPDSDLRTMCDRCMIPLEVKDVAAPGPPVAKGRPSILESAPPLALPRVEMPSIAEAAITKPAAPTAEPPAVTPPSPQRPTPQNEVVAQAAEQANYRATAWAVLAWLSGLAAVWFALRAATVGAGAGASSALLLLAAMIWFVWEWSRWSWVRRIETTFPGRVSLGGPMSFAVLVEAAKDLAADKVLVRLRATETSWEGAGKRVSRRVRPVVNLQKVLAERINLKPGQQLKLAGEIGIPAEAPATFTSDVGSILWMAHLWVAIPGFHADIRQRFPVRVIPYRAGEPAGQPWPERWKPLLDLRDCRAELGLEADLDKQGNFALETGRATLGRLRILPLDDIDATGVLVELAYEVESSGMAEVTSVCHQVLSCPSLKKGVEVNWEFTLPGLDGPLSFRGAGLFVKWALGVAVHRKQGSPLMARLPITVRPGPAR